MHTYLGHKKLNILVLRPIHVFSKTDAGGSMVVFLSFYFINKGCWIISFILKQCSSYQNPERSDVLKQI